VSVSVSLQIIICVEVMNFYAQFVCNNDLEMYHAETNKRANMAAAGLAAEIGQITHIFSDKTGTLTRNEMKLVGCFINGARYGYIPPSVDVDGDNGLEQPQETLPETEASTKADSQPDIEQGPGATAKAVDGDDAASQESMKSIDIEEVFRPVIEMLRDPAFGNATEREAVWQFFLLLSVCHTVVVDFDDQGQLTYNAESPDEDAFVRCAAQLGFVLTGTGDGGITIKTPLGDERKFKVLAINPFNSTRKRMSLVVQNVSTGEVQCMAKGADNVMLERLAPGQEHLVTPLNDALVQYSWNGLRTLVMGSRVLTEAEFREWDAENKAAKVKPPEQRMEAIAASAEKIERGMRFIGASAIEDQLQLGVPEAIKTLREAGTQVWVLTGDKVETAINIGLSCNLIDPQMLQVKLVSEELEVLDQQLQAICAVIDTVEMKVDKLMEARADAIDKVEAKSSKETDTKGMEYAFSNEELGQLKELIEKRGAASGDRGVGGFVDDEVSADLCPKLRIKGRCSNLCARFSAWLKDVQSFAVTINPRTDDVQVEAALIVSGSSLQRLLKAQAGNAELEKRLLRVARFCKVVLACRVSPAQKSLIVEMVRYAEDNQYRKLLPVTLAIGDGANDVPMIQSAHLGVGISGHEGTQAVNSADFSIAQFRFLVRLMLVHGRWNYRRQAKVILFVIYTWILYTLLLFAYLPYSLWSGQQVFYFLSYISVFAYFANVTIVTHGWFSRDISPECALSHPWTYGHSVLGKDLKGVKLVITVWRAILHAVLIWIISVLTLPLGVSVDVLGSAVYNGIICVIFIMSATAGDTQTAVTALVFLIMIAAYLGLVGTTTTPNNIFSPPQVANEIWTNTILVVFAVVVFDMAVLHLKKEYWPSTLEVLVEQDRGYYMGDKYGRSARKDAINVMKELGVLTVVPLTLGAKNVGKLVNSVPEGHDASEQHAEEGTTGSPRGSPRLGGTKGGDGVDAGTGTAAGTAGATKKGRFFGASSAIGRFTPQFDLDMPTLGDVQKGFEVGLDKVTLGRVKIGEAAHREAVRDFEAEMISYSASANRMNIAEMTSVMPAMPAVEEEEESASSATSLPTASGLQDGARSEEDVLRDFV
jgi:magnesium-transporting ATPase (P-type)